MVKVLHTFREEEGALRAAAIALIIGLVPLAARAQSLLPLANARIERGLVLLEPGDGRGDDVWNPGAFRASVEEKVFSLLPDGLEDVARTFVERTVQIDLRPDRAFVRLRLPL